MTTSHNSMQVGGGDRCGGGVASKQGYPVTAQLDGGGGGGAKGAQGCCPVG
jgi:hypothetical protein